jgi:hypothetical protein
MLNASLAAVPKTKAQKDAELKKKEDEIRKQKEEEARELKAARLKVRVMYGVSNTYLLHNVHRILYW